MAPDNNTPAFGTGEDWTGEGLIGLTIITLALALTFLYFISP